ncbi:MAG: hypothetical protein U1F49_02220 [Rubrivivax sp.]
MGQPIGPARVRPLIREKQAAHAAGAKIRPALRGLPRTMVMMVAAAAGTK